MKKRAEMWRKRQPRQQHQQQHGLGVLVLLVIGVIVVKPVTVSANADSTGSSGSAGTPANNNVYRYNICNGLSNQLLYHSAEIAIGSAQNKHIEIPDYFIVNGVQTTGENVLPNMANSMPFEVVFDKAHFQKTLQDELNINATFVKFDFSRQPIPCAGWQSIYHAEPQRMRNILHAFRPSKYLQQLIQGVTNSIRAKGMSMDEGICLHHRDGQDWHQHCAAWSNLRDGVYRGNCLGVPGRSFVESLEDRGLEAGKWVYYCGDHDIPRELSSPKNPYHVLSRQDVMDPQDIQAVVDLVERYQPQSAQPLMMRDIWAWIDFNVCGTLPHFIGNSASTFSAMQIALRQSQNSYWYNSQSIPLADMWRVFDIPIVYTYTELSMESGKRMLQASITSVRKHMPHNPIHILYHGRRDQAFQLWLQQEPQNVILHAHRPAWKGQIEAMRKNGDLNTSHLFGHAGNYLGTWQRIDIPLFIHSEYCLLLDADTIVLQPFTLADFGLDLTYGLAMSSEYTAKPQIPFNAGVMLMNVPKLRQTYPDFIDFIYQHVSHPIFESVSPSDQGAYLEFYKKDLRFLNNIFNFKAYWELSDVEYQSPIILHFHGAKPHDFLKKIMGAECDLALKIICERVMQLPFLCPALANFAQALIRLPSISTSSSTGSSMLTGEEEPQHGVDSSSSSGSSNNHNNHALMSPIATYCNASFLTSSSTASSAVSSLINILKAEGNNINNNNHDDTNSTLIRQAQALYCTELLYLLATTATDHPNEDSASQTATGTSTTTTTTTSLTTSTRTNQMCSDLPYLLRTVLYRLPDPELGVLREPVLRITHNAQAFSLSRENSNHYNFWGGLLLFGGTTTTPNNYNSSLFIPSAMMLMLIPLSSFVASVLFLWLRWKQRKRTLFRYQHHHHYAIRNSRIGMTGTGVRHK